MCGIFGVINFDGQPVDKQKVLSARDTLAHRGPDDEGIYYSTINQSRPDVGQSSNQPTIALAHRRLSIIDLSPAAHQPMASDDNRFVIVFNGEIYNYVGLSQKSKVKSQKFKSHSDTEILLYLFAEYGSDCLNMLRGMFAFAIWDDKEKKLFAARDRFGIKPFYYLHNEKEFIFSSELKAIKHYKNRLTLSMQGMDAFLKTGSVPAPLTIYEETKALLPGHWIECQKSEVKTQKYWSFFDLINSSNTSTPLSITSTILTDLSLREVTSLPVRQERRSNLSYNNNVNKIIRASLLDSIRAHMVSDVEVGTFLSGGIDSTAIVSLMRQVGKEKIKTVSIVFPDSKFDESKYSQLAAKNYNTEHIEISFYEKDLLDDFDKIMDSMDQPTIDGINTYFVSKAAKLAGLKVVLSGLGGDELFGGYPSFNLIPKYQRIKNLPFAKMFMKLAAPLLKNKLPAKAIEYMKNPDTQNAEYRLVRGLFTNDELAKLGWHSESQMSKVKSQTGEIINQITDDLLINAPMTFNSSGTPDTLRSSLTPMQYVSMMESSFYMRNQLLRDSDIFSMAHSIELRVPFVDHILYATVLPYLDDAYDKNFPKKMLVEAVGDIPEEIVHRSKMGFTLPFEEWMRKGKIKEVIKDSPLSTKMKEYLNSKALENLQKDFENNTVHWSRVWALNIVGKII